MDFVIFSSFFLLTFISIITQKFSSSTESKEKAISNVNFLAFQRSFCGVYFLALIGDWLQGPYVYNLYQYYGFNEGQIAVLYVAGFASSVLFGTATGPIADNFGRKKTAQAFCIIYTFCCFSKLFNQFSVLMIGRIFGGIATSMLFSTFESWYVYEHTERHGFPAEWIGVTFSMTTFYNGLLAILAGIVANFSAETAGYGPVAPFVIAMVPLTLAGIIITKTWNENHGNKTSTSNLRSSCMTGLSVIFQDSKILYLGGIQTAVESCMYIFVFMWTPVLMPGNPPLGMVFASFMVCIMIGSSLFSILTAGKKYPASTVLKFTLYLIGICMAICCVTVQNSSYSTKKGEESSNIHLMLTYFAFLLLELGIGMYFPAISFLKSQIIPETYRANVMNWFRVPMNVITCTALLCLKIDFISKDKRYVFFSCLILSLCGLLCIHRFVKSVGHSNNANNDESKKSLIENEETP